MGEVAGLRAVFPASCTTLAFYFWSTIIFFMKFFWFRLSLLVFLFWGSEGMAQEVVARLDVGRREPLPDYYEYSPVDGGIVTLGPASRSSSRYVALTKYDARLKKAWTQQVMEQNGHKNIDLLTVIGDHIMVFVSEFFPKEGIIKTYYFSYDLDGNELASEAILSIYPNQKEHKVDLQYVLSPDKRRLVCYKNLENRREAEEILYYLFDTSGELVSNGEIVLRYPDNRFRMRSLRVSNQGNVFILGKFYRATRVTDSNDFSYLVYRHNTRTLEGEELPIELGDRFISDLAFRLDRDENIYVAGFYSNRGTDQIAGTLFQKISPYGVLEQSAIQAFDANFLSNYLSSGQIERGRELRNFVMDPMNGIILRSDGGVLLIAEQFYITYRTYQDMRGMWVDRAIYHYDDVILTSVSPEGRIEWHAIVDKQQQSDVQASLSYFNAIGGQGAYIFYEYKPRRMDFNVYYNLVTIDGDISVRKPLFRDYRYGNEFYPRYCEQINNQEALMVYLQNRGRTLSVVKVRFEED
ncbi:MAG: hypothetical protein D6722_07030 [Bacteroidetes bacterium]|nr:MAG: hypothetical protein D6722_07030 [Bacteroidota bacterium]